MCGKFTAMALWRAALPTDRMPAVLVPEDWAVWLGEESADLERVKACLKTREEPTWTMKAEDRPGKKPTVSDPTGLL